MTSVDYRAVSAVGAVIATFGELALARKWARENAQNWPGLRVEAVTVTTSVATVYRPRAHLRIVAA